MWEKGQGQANAAEWGRGSYSELLQCKKTVKKERERLLLTNQQWSFQLENIHEKITLTMKNKWSQFLCRTTTVQKQEWSWKTPPPSDPEPASNTLFCHIQRRAQTGQSNSGFMTPLTPKTQAASWRLLVALLSLWCFFLEESGAWIYSHLVMEIDHEPLNQFKNILV